MKVRFICHFKLDIWYLKCFISQDFTRHIAIKLFSMTTILPLISRADIGDFPLYASAKVVYGFGRGSKQMGVPTGEHSITDLAIPLKNAVGSRACLFASSCFLRFTMLPIL